MLSELMLDWHYMDILYATWLECMLVYFKAAKGPSPSLVHDSLELYRSSTFLCLIGGNKPLRQATKPSSAIKKMPAGAC